FSTFCYIFYIFVFYFFFFYFCFFFFQAEDGIRDLIVTGVQTCALPILGLALGPAIEFLVKKGASLGARNQKGLTPLTVTSARPRSEERRVGKECRSRWSPDH